MRILAALAFAAILPTSAQAAPAKTAAPPKTIKGQIAKDLRQRDPSLKFKASSIVTKFKLTQAVGTRGSFSLVATRPGSSMPEHLGLPKTFFNVTGGFAVIKGPATISHVIIKQAPIQVEM